MLLYNKMNLLELIDYLDEEMVNWYMYYYETDDLEELITYLHKCGFNKEKVIEVFSSDELFFECWQSFLSSRQ